MPKNFRRFVDDKNLQPLKDYDDYATFINDAFRDDKKTLLAKAHQTMDRKRISYDFKPKKPMMNTLFSAPVSPTNSELNTLKRSDDDGVVTARASIPDASYAIKNQDLHQYLGGIMKPKTQAR